MVTTGMKKADTGIVGKIEDKGTGNLIEALLKPFTIIFDELVGKPANEAAKELAQALAGVPPLLIAVGKQWKKFEEDLGNFQLTYGTVAGLAMKSYSITSEGAADMLALERDADTAGVDVREMQRLAFVASQTEMPRGRFAELYGSLKVGEGEDKEAVISRIAGLGNRDDRRQALVGLGLNESQAEEFRPYVDIPAQKKADLRKTSEKYMIGQDGIDLAREFTGSQGLLGAQADAYKRRMALGLMPAGITGMGFASDLADKGIDPFSELFSDLGAVLDSGFEALQSKFMELPGVQNFLGVFDTLGTVFKNSEDAVAAFTLGMERATSAIGNLADQYARASLLPFEPSLLDRGINTLGADIATSEFSRTVLPTVAAQPGPHGAFARDQVIRIEARMDLHAHGGMITREDLIEAGKELESSWFRGINHALASQGE